MPKRLKTMVLLGHFFFFFCNRIRSNDVNVDLIYLSHCGCLIFFKLQHSSKIPGNIFFLN